MKTYRKYAVTCILLTIPLLCGCVKADAEPMSALFSDEPAPSTPPFTSTPPI